MQRPNAVTQLQVIGEQANIAVFAPEQGNGVGNPIEVAKSGIEFAKKKLHNFVIVDTAGRLGIDTELMNQAFEIRKAINPDEVLLVVDSMIGQDAVRTAKAFDDGVGIDGIVLTKLDGDARGGAALSISSITGKPIFFAAFTASAGVFARMLCGNGNPYARNTSWPSSSNRLVRFCFLTESKTFFAAAFLVGNFVIVPSDVFSHLLNRSIARNARIAPSA